MDFELCCSLRNCSNPRCIELEADSPGAALVGHGFFIGRNLRIFPTALFGGYPNKRRKIKVGRFLRNSLEVKAKEENM